MSEKVRRRGLMYMCLHCEKAGKLYTGVKYRVRSHVTKHHIALADSAFYCTLCLFRSNTEEDLRKHVKTYSRHVSMQKEMGNKGKDSRYLVCNPTARGLIEGIDYRMETVEERQSGMSAVEDPLMLNDEDDGLITLRVTSEILADLMSRPNQQERSNVVRNIVPNCPTNVSMPVTDRLSTQQLNLPYTAAKLCPEENLITPVIDTYEQLNNSRLLEFDFLEALCSTPNFEKTTVKTPNLQTPLIKGNTEENILQQILPDNELNFANFDWPMSVSTQKSPETVIVERTDEETQTDEPERKKRKVQEEGDDSKKYEEALEKIVSSVEANSREIQDVRKSVEQVKDMLSSLQRTMEDIRNDIRYGRREPERRVESTISYTEARQRNTDDNQYGRNDKQYSRRDDKLHSRDNRQHNRGDDRQHRRIDDKINSTGDNRQCRGKDDNQDNRDDKQHSRGDDKQDNRDDKQHSRGDDKQRSRDDKQHSRGDDKQHNRDDKQHSRRDDRQHRRRDDKQHSRGDNKQNSRENNKQHNSNKELDNSQNKRKLPSREDKHGEDKENRLALKSVINTI